MSLTDKAIKAKVNSRECDLLLVIFLDQEAASHFWMESWAAASFVAAAPINRPASVCWATKKPGWIQQLLLYEVVCSGKI